jgi:hypothetical protein
MMHDGLVGVLTCILKDVRISDIEIVSEARELRATHVSRPRDVVVSDFFCRGQTSSG